MAGYSTCENGAGFCLQSVACLDDDSRRAGTGRQRGERGAFLSLWQEDRLLRR